MADPAEGRDLTSGLFALSGADVWPRDRAEDLGCRCPAPIPYRATRDALFDGQQWAGRARVDPVVLHLDRRHDLGVHGRRRTQLSDYASVPRRICLNLVIAVETAATEGISITRGLEPGAANILPGTIVGMSGRGVPKHRLCSAVVLAILCLLVGGACLLPGDSSHIANAATPMSLYDTAEVHHWEPVQPGMAVTRARHGLVVQPVWLPLAVSTFALGGAALLVLLMSRRSALLSLASDSAGWQRLLYLGINRR